MLGYFIVGIALLLALIIGGNALATARPEKIVKAIRIAAMISLGGGALFFGLTGRIQLASGLVFLALFFFRNKPFFSSSSPSDGQTSDVKTNWLHAQLDHDSGDMDALILKGEFDGKRLSHLSRDELQTLHGELYRDAQSVSILETYILRNFPDDDMGSEDQNTDQGQGQRQNQRSNPSGLSVAEAYEILELKPGATLPEIKNAHRRLIKKFHPDHDGSAYMAAKINLAKDILMKSE
ncbi:MAG: DnaJ domain-containing protein [Sneathiella sp.]